MGGVRPANFYYYYYFLINATVCFPPWRERKGRRRGAREERRGDMSDSEAAGLAAEGKRQDIGRGGSCRVKIACVTRNGGLGAGVPPLHSTQCAWCAGPGRPSRPPPGFWGDFCFTISTSFGWGRRRRRNQQQPTNTKKLGSARSWPARSGPARRPREREERKKGEEGGETRPNPGERKEGKGSERIATPTRQTKEPTTPY